MHYVHIRTQEECEFKRVHVSFRTLHLASMLICHYDMDKVN